MYFGFNLMEGGLHVVVVQLQLQKFTIKTPKLQLIMAMKVDKMMLELDAIRSLKLTSKWTYHFKK